MGLYDAVDRGGAGRKKEKTLRKPLLIAAAIIAAVVALAVWACRYQLQFRSFVSALTDATRHARSTGDFTVTVDGAAVPAGADDLSDLLRLITASGAGRTGRLPPTRPSSPSPTATARYWTSGRRRWKTPPTTGRKGRFSAAPSPAAGPTATTPTRSP